MRSQPSLQALPPLNDLDHPVLPEARFYLPLPNHAIDDDEGLRDPHEVVEGLLKDKRDPRSLRVRILALAKDDPSQ